MCPDFCRRVPGVWVCVREIELDHRQRGGRSSRERVIGPGETRLLRPSSCPAGLRQNTDTCSGSSSSRCSRGGWGGAPLRRPSCGQGLSWLQMPSSPSLAPNMPPPADPAPPRPGKAPQPQPGMLGGGPGSPAVHVLRDGGIGDGLGWVQAALAAQAAAVATEAAKLPPRWVVGGDAPGLGVEGVVVVNVVIVPVPRMTRRTRP